MQLSFTQPTADILSPFLRLSLSNTKVLEDVVQRFLTADLAAGDFGTLL